MHHDLTYFLGIMPHILGVIVAIYVVYKHEDKFKSSNIKQLFSCNIERYFMWVWLSVFVNCMAILEILPRWLASRPVLGNDYIYVFFHVGVGALVIILNLMTCKELKRTGKGWQ